MNYILKGHEPVRVDDALSWAKWFETADDERRVDETIIGAVRVSTVFLGTDHNFFGKGPPLLFETMIFGGPEDLAQWRCSTWDEAIVQHANAVALVGAG